MKRAPVLVLLPLAIVSTIACGLSGPTEQPSPVAPADMEVGLSPAPESFSLVTPHPDQGDLASLLAAYAGRAAELGRNPFVEFSAAWCPPCVALAENLDDPRIVEAFRGTYIIRLDYDEWKDRLSGTGFTVVGVPTFFELDGSGNPTGRIITGTAWGEDIPENMAPPLRAFFRGGSPE